MELTVKIILITALPILVKMEHALMVLTRILVLV